MIHVRCISNINHWYMTVIHLLEFRTLYWQGLQLVSWTLHPECPQLWVELKFSPCSLQTNREGEDDFFDCGTIPYWLSSQCCRQGMYQLLEWHWHSTENWKCWQDTVESGKFSSNSTQVYHRLHQEKRLWLNRSKCHAAGIWVTQCLRNFCYWKQTTVYFRIEGYWHCYLFST